MTRRHPHEALWQCQPEVVERSLANGNSPDSREGLRRRSQCFCGAALGAVVIRYLIPAALWLATAISALCSAALFRSMHTSDKP
jgi:hypothetical protein